VLPDVHGEFFSEVIRGVDVAARKAGYHILVSGSHSDPGEMLEVLEAMRGRVDGLVVMAPDVALSALSSSRAIDLPLVLLNTADDAHDAITIDNYGGARTMIRHLAQLGHTRIAFIKGPDQNADARERLRGYRRPCARFPAESGSKFTAISQSTPATKRRCRSRASARGERTSRPLIASRADETSAPLGPPPSSRRTTRWPSACSPRSPTGAWPCRGRCRSSASTTSRSRATSPRR